MFLVLFVDEMKPFDVASMNHGLERLENVAKIGGQSFGCASTYELRSGPARALIRLDATSIMVDGLNEASLTAAFCINQISNEPVHIVDDANTLEVMVSDFGNVAELEDAFRNAGAYRAATYQKKVAGATERLISGGGELFWSDGLDYQTVIEAKLLTRAERSPYLSESQIPDFLRAQITNKVSAEFARLALVIRDVENPLTLVQVVVSDSRLRPFFKAQLKHNRLKGNVTVVRE